MAPVESGYTPTMQPTFLQLPPEMGGLRFGPFPGDITIGSDQKRCQIVMDPSHGVFPVHAKIGPLGGGAFTVAPATPKCKVFIMPAGQVHVWPITGPVQARVGDLVVVGTPGGPRFQLQTQGPAAPPPSAQQIVQTAKQTGGEAGFVQGASQMIDGLFRPSTRGGVAGEVRRQAQSRMIARNPAARQFYAVWTRMRTNVFNNPYYWVAGAIALFSLFGTGTLSCSGLGYVLMDVLAVGR